MQETDTDRESRLRELASRLLFTLTKEGSRFSLYTGRPMYRIPFGTMTSRSTTWKRRSRPGSFAGHTAVDEFAILTCRSALGRKAIDYRKFDPRIFFISSLTFSAAARSATPTRISVWVRV